MTDHLDLAGQQVGDYRLLRWLGGGGFGNVYLAEQVRDHSQVAIKLLQIRLSRSEELRAFINEARTIRLKHAHIVPLLDFGISRENIPYLVMEYAAQGTLRDHYPKGTQMPLATVVSYVQQVASALQYTHEERLVHRDVKPENMLLRMDGTVLLSDFGIASIAHSSHSLSLHQGIGGTLPYMAPEQIRGQAQAASDQYSLGVVVYEWVTGRCPFEGTAAEVAMQHAMMPPPSLVAQVATLPGGVDPVVLKALSKEPRERFQSVQAFADALEQAALPLTVPTLATPAPLSSQPLQASPNTTAKELPGGIHVLFLLSWILFDIIAAVVYASEGLNSVVPLLIASSILFFFWGWVVTQVTGRFRTGVSRSVRGAIAVALGVWLYMAISYSNGNYLLALGFGVFLFMIPAWILLTLIGFASSGLGSLIALPIVAARRSRSLTYNGPSAKTLQLCQKIQEKIVSKARECWRRGRPAKC